MLPRTRGQRAGPREQMKPPPMIAVKGLLRKGHSDGTMRWSRG